MIVTGKITTKGQTTLPAEVRNRLGVGPGDHIDYILGDDGVVQIKRARTLADLCGILKSEVSLTDAELDQAIEEAWNARADEIMVRFGK
jgi:antitoxin PrlF